MAIDQDKINVTGPDALVAKPEAAPAAEVTTDPPATPEAPGEAPTDAEKPAETTPKAEAAADAEDSKASAPQKGLAQRIGGLERDKRAKDIEIERLNTELANIQGKEIPAGDVKAEAPGKPNIDDFETTELYIEALTQHVATEAVKADRVEQDRINREFQAQQTEATERSTYLDREGKFSEATPDYYDVVMADNTLPFTAEMAEAIRTSENGPAVWYALSKDRAEVERIAAMAPVAQMVEIGKVEARIAAGVPATTEAAPAAPAGPPAPKTVSTAPAPITPVGGGGGVAPNPENMSMEEYKAWRKAGGGR